MNAPALRRRLWLPLFLLLLAAITCAASLFRRVGLGEIALVLAPLAVVVMIESIHYLARQFLRGYRDRDKVN